MIYTIIDSPVGGILIAEGADGVAHIDFQDGDDPLAPDPNWVRVERLPSGAERQLEAYFRGERRHFELPLAPQGTPFQQQVWHALEGIPFGETVSYLELAQRLGNRDAVRAVAAANGRNPLPIVIPCHRVIGSDGSLTGFAGGIHLKAELLALETRGANPLGL